MQAGSVSFVRIFASSRAIAGRGSPVAVTHTRYNFGWVMNRSTVTTPRSQDFVGWRVVYISQSGAVTAHPEPRLPALLCGGRYLESSRWALLARSCVTMRRLAAKIQLKAQLIERPGYYLCAKFGLTRVQSTVPG